MSCVDYCTVLPSWEFDKDPACIVTYAFGQENERTDVDDSGEDISENYSPHNSLILQSPKECGGDDMGETEPCVISVTCKPQYRVSVIGLHIISESRTVEVYDTSEGYLMTARGRTLQMSDGEDGQEQHRLYRCKISLKESLYGLSVKFLSLRGKQTLALYNIMFILKPEATDFSPPREPTPGLIDMSKVKDYVHDMGDDIPQGARNLMNSMEDYQANQKSMMSGLQGIMTQGATSGGDKFGMLGLMSILSQVSNKSRSSAGLQTSTNIQNTDNHLATTDSKPRDRRAHIDFRNAERGCSAGSHQNTMGQMGDTGGKENADMFSLLQNICGKVSQMREDEKKAEDTQNDNSLNGYDESGESQQVSSCDVAPETTATAPTMGEDSSLVTEKHLIELEKRLTDHIDQQFSKMETKLNEKFENLMTVLSVLSEGNKKNYNSVSSQTLNSEDGIDES